MENREAYSPEEVMKIVSVYNEFIGTALRIKPTVEMRRANVRESSAEDIKAYLTIVPENIRPLFIKNLETELICSFGSGRMVELIIKEIK